MNVFHALKSSKNFKFQNIVRFCQYFILTCEIWRLKALISNFATQIFLGTKMVPILSLNSSNSFQFLNKKYINKAYKCDFTAKRGTPNGTQKKFFENCKFGAFQRRVSHAYSHPRSKVTYLSIFMIFWYFIEFAKISLFRLKLSKNLQSL